MNSIASFSVIASVILISELPIDWKICSEYVFRRKKLVQNC